MYLLVFSCQSEEILYSETIIDNGIVNTEFLTTVDEVEKALICGYLFAYGNECNDTPTNVKCQVLNDLNITNECDTNHINFLNDWFKNDIIMFYKLKNCPNLPSNSAIQNEIKHMSLYRNNDTLKINILVYGLNNSEEKNWNTEQTDTYLIKNNTFSKIETITAKNTLKSNCLGCVNSK
jgi:hypothetical protein